MSSLTGRLRHRITIQEPVEEQDSETGAYSLSWEDIYTSVPAEVLTGPGREFYASASKQAEIAARITVRWLDADSLDLCKCRILWEGRTFNISSAETDATARREWRFRCEDSRTDGA